MTGWTRDLHFLFLFLSYPPACVHCFLPISDRVNNFPPLPNFLRIKPCFYQNIEDEIPGPHQQLVRRAYTLWMCKFTSLLFKIIRHISPLMFYLSTSFYLLFAACSVFWHAVHECDLMHRLVGRRGERHKLWLFSTLAHPLQPLQLHLLVQTALQSLQVSHSLLNEYTVPLLPVFLLYVLKPDEEDLRFIIERV